MRKIQIRADFNGYKILDVIEVPEDITGINIDTTVKEMLLEKLSMNGKISLQKIKKGNSNMTHKELYEEREWLIGELAIAEGKEDEDAIISLSCELYERFGWSGAPYYTH